MAAGDVILFDEFTSLDYTAGWAGTDVIKVAILDNTATPADTTATPALGDFTEVGTAGSYTAGGTSIGDWATVNSQTAGTGTLDSATNPSWAQNASNDTDAYWGLIYNDTQAGDPAIGYVDLGGPVNMAAGSLTITWNGSGIISITKTP